MSSGRILVVDDDENTRQLLCELCTSSGYEVVAAADGQAAIDAALRDAPDAILLDLMLPKVDGLSVIQRLRGEPKTKETPVLVLTAINDIEGKVRGIEAGANDYLTKPFKLFELQTRLKAAIEGASSRRQLEDVQAELAELKDVDPIVGAGTYAQLRASLDYEMNRARRYARPLACVVLAVLDADDRAREIGAGGAARLQVLTTTRLRKILRRVDRLFRLDMDEYLALLPETEIGGARRAAHRMLAGLDEASGDGEPGLKAAAGVSAYPGAAITTGDELLRAASQGLDNARIKGPGAVAETTG